jgi:hypothetical protein
MRTPEKIIFVLSTGRTGTKTLAEGLAAEDIRSPHQPPFSRLLTIASNCYLHGWLPSEILEWLVTRLREPQLLNSDSRYYVQVFSLDYFPAKIISERYPNVYVVHIVRDPRTFVHSYLNWMHTRFKSWVANKLVPCWHPSGFFTGEMSWRQWRQLDDFQRVCWHWKYKNAVIERLFDGYERYLRIRFEDLFLAQRVEILRDLLTFAGIPYEERLGAMLQTRTNESRKTHFPVWEDWSVKRRRQLVNICGERMTKYGYSGEYERAD